MKQKFHGTLEQLQAAVTATQIQGNWTDAGDGKHVFRSAVGGVLSWWPKKGTLLFQGGSPAKERLEKDVMEQLNFGTTAEATLTPVGLNSGDRSIFVVHGHDVEARDQLELVLHRLGLKPFILMNTSGGGKTIIEALEGKIGRDYSSAFGIVLMTPDDAGYAKSDGPEKEEPRARQNVILEIGMLLSSLTRERMALLVKGHLEVPSDLQSLIQLRFNDHVREIVPKLCSRFGEAGIQLDPDKISAASA